MSPNKDFLICLASLEDRIKSACKKAGRDPSEVLLMAVTKTKPAEVADWALDAGLVHIGENRVQEAAAKRPEVRNSSGFWELIGPLQSNKARTAVKVFDRIQTVDRFKLVHILDRICEEEEREALPVLLQANVGEDPAKHGCATREAPALAEAISSSKHLKLEGLMTIGEFTDEEARVRRTFVRLRELRSQLEDALGMPLPVLSMGMTGDLEWAIEEGSTLIRVGTALFGARG
jgi:pyridoxal phosphate enzyme (YggS family)